MNQLVGSTVAPASERDGPGDWWKTVTPGEVRSSVEVVGNFLNRDGAATFAEVEAFARALALRQLLSDRKAYINAANFAINLMPSIPQEKKRVEMLLRAKAWLARGHAISAGLKACRHLLRPKNEQEWWASFEHFELKLCLLQSDCDSAAAHSELPSEHTDNTPVKPRIRKA